jgi:hypothetical protein
MNDKLDLIIFYVAYDRIAESQAKRVAGSTVWDHARMVVPDLAPVTVPARLKRLVSIGLLQKDPANSSSRTKIYAPTASGYRKWEELRSATSSNN